MLSRKHFAIPYALFLIAFIVCPLVLIVIYSITTPDFKLTLDNYKVVFTIDSNNASLLRGFEFISNNHNKKINRRFKNVCFFVAKL